MPRVVLDFDPEQPSAPGFGSDTSELVFFLSWAFSQRYGASHELTEASLILRNEHKIDLSPLLTFADREVEDPDDADVLERSWQDPAPLVECCSSVVEALQGDDERFTALRDEYPRLVENVAELGRIAKWAAEQGCRLRITYELEAE